MITSTAIVIKRYLRVTNSLAKLFWMVRCLLEKEFPVQMNSGSARAQHLRDGLIRVEGPIDAPAVDIPWNQSSMSHHDLNMLPLCDSIRKCYDDHYIVLYFVRGTLAIPATSLSRQKPERRRDRVEQDVKIHRQA
jgi:hypothetical protein